MPGQTSKSLPPDQSEEASLSTYRLLGDGHLSLRQPMVVPAHISLFPPGNLVVPAREQA
jgi:hypothetical protein